MDYADLSALAGSRAPVLEVIASAATNQRLVRLSYEAESGSSEREVEPYALRQSKDGRLYLLAADRSRQGETRNFRFDRIRQVEVPGATFQPRFEVEFVVAASPREGAGAHPVLPRVGRPAKQAAQPKGQGRSDYHPRARGGAAFTVVCPSCGRRFTESVYRTSLVAHKSEAGAPCEGRHGFPV